MKITAVLLQFFDMDMSFFKKKKQTYSGLGQLTVEISRSHSVRHHARWDSSGREIGPSQRPLPNNTQYSQETYMSLAGFEPAISASKRLQTYLAATGIGRYKLPEE